MRLIALCLCSALSYNIFNFLPNLEFNESVRKVASLALSTYQVIFIFSDTSWIKEISLPICKFEYVWLELTTPVQSSPAVMLHGDDESIRDFKIKISESNFVGKDR